MTQSKSDAAKFASFVGTGVITYLVFSILAETLLFFNVQYALAISISFIPSSIFHFASNRKFLATKGGSSVIWRQGLRYLIFTGAACLFHVLVSILIVGNLGFGAFISTAVSTILWLPIGFRMMKAWVFMSDKETNLDSN